MSPASGGCSPWGGCWGGARLYSREVRTRQDGPIARSAWIEGGCCRDRAERLWRGGDPDRTWLPKSGFFLREVVAISQSQGPRSSGDDPRGGGCWLRKTLRGFWHGVGFRYDEGDGIDNGGLHSSDPCARREDVARPPGSAQDWGQLWQVWRDE